MSKNNSGKKIVVGYVLMNKEEIYKRQIILQLKILKLEK